MAGSVREKFGRRIDRQAQYLGDILVLVAHFQGLGVVAGAAAGRARRVHAGQEQQLDHDEAFAVAMLAASLGHVEGKSPRVVFAAFRHLGRRKQFADMVEQPRVSGKVRTRGPPDGFLVDPDQALDLLQSRDDVALHGFGRRTFQRIRFPGRIGHIRLNRMAQSLGHQLDQHLADQGRFTGARHARDRRQRAEGKLDGQVTQIVARHPFQAQPAGRFAGRAQRWRRRIEQEAPRLRVGHLLQAGRLAAVQNLAALLARGGAHVDNPVGVADHVQRMLDDEQGIAGRLQLGQRAQQGLRVGRMQARRRLVQHVDDAEQVRAHLRRQPQALQFAGRQGGRAALEREVTQPQRQQHVQARRQVGGNALGDDAFFRVRIMFSLTGQSRVAGSAWGRSSVGQARQRQPRQCRQYRARRT